MILRRLVMLGGQLRRSAQRLTARAALGWGDSSGGGGRLGNPASAQGDVKRLPRAAAALQAPQVGYQRGSRSMGAISVRIRSLSHRPSSVPSLHGENIESLALSLVLYRAKGSECTRLD